MSDAAVPLSLTLSETAVATILREHYGLLGVRFTAMSSELATVSRVETDDNRRLAFKAMHWSPRDVEVFGWQITAMEHLDSRGIPTGATVPTTSGDRVAVIESHDTGGLDGRSAGSASIMVHVGEWLPGAPLEAIVPSPAVLRSVGQKVEKIMECLANYPGPPAHVTHPWQLTQTLKSLEQTTPSVDHPEVRPLLDQAMGRFSADVEPRLASLPHTVVHQDLHDANLLVDQQKQEVSGVLDFGDMVWGPRIAELAVAAGYGCRTAADPLTAYLGILDGWTGKVRLESIEVDLLLSASIGRLAVNLSVWNARASSDRGDYARRRSSTSAHALRTLINADPLWMRSQFRARLGA